MSNRDTNMENERKESKFRSLILRLFSCACMAFCIMGILILINIELARNFKMDEDDAMVQCCKQLESTKNLIKVLKKSNENSKDMLLAARDYREKDQDIFSDVSNAYYTMSQESDGCHDRLDALRRKCEASEEDCALGIEIAQ